MDIPGQKSPEQPILVGSAEQSNEHERREAEKRRFEEAVIAYVHEHPEERSIPKEKIDSGEYEPKEIGNFEVMVAFIMDKEGHVWLQEEVETKIFQKGGNYCVAKIPGDVGVHFETMKVSEKDNHVTALQRGLQEEYNPEGDLGGVEDILDGLDAGSYEMEYLGDVPGFAAKAGLGDLVTGHLYVMVLDGYNFSDFGRRVNPNLEEIQFMEYQKLDKLEEIYGHKLRPGMDDCLSVVRKYFDERRREKE